VAAANPRTVVVLNTGEPSLMPWLRHVAAVLEACTRAKRPARPSRKYLAAASTLRSTALTFPASENEMPKRRRGCFPGVDGTVDFGSNLDIGYRWYQATHVTPTVRLRLRTRLHELRSVRSADYRVDEWRRSRVVSHERGRSEWLMTSAGLRT